jgi:methyl-accepting chemotaxis protein
MFSLFRKQDRQNLAGMSAGRKLMLGTTTLLALLVIVSGLGFLCNWSLESAFDRSVNEGLHRLLMSSAINRASSDMMLGQTRFVLLTLQNDPDASDAARQAVHANSERALKTAAQLRDSVTATEDKKTVQQLVKDLTDWSEGFGEMEKSLAADNIPEAMATNDRLQPIYRELGALGEKIESTQLAALEHDKRSARIQGWISNLVTGISLVLALVIGTIVIRVVRETNSTLRELSNDVASGGHQIAGAASQVSRASQQLAEQASQQSASLRETATSAKQLLSVVRQSSEWARDAVALTGETEEHVRQGNSDIRKLAVSMNSIADSSRRIAAIVRTIEEIAFQTKILSLNAAIEAAHAGDAGAGFSVVASEVQKLAQRCTQAAADSNVLLDESASRTSESTQCIQAMEASIREITSQCGRVKELISDIDSGTSDQTRNLAQIDSAIGELEVVTDSVAATAEESASMASEFSAQSETLRSVVERLSGFVGGSQSAAFDLQPDLPA